MKKIIFLLTFLFITVLAFSQVGLFLYVDMGNDDLAQNSIFQSIISELDELKSNGSSTFYPAPLMDADVELLIRGMRIVHNNAFIGYAISASVVFHDPELVAYSDHIVLTCNPNAAGLQWAAESIVDYLDRLVGRVGQQTDQSNWR